jgi:hypothetical protein
MGIKRSQEGATLKAFYVDKRNLFTHVSFGYYGLKYWYTTVSLSLSLSLSVYIISL